MASISELRKPVRGTIHQYSPVVATAPSLLVLAHRYVLPVVVLSLLNRGDAVDDRLLSELDPPRSSSIRLLALLQDALCA